MNHSTTSSYVVLQELGVFVYDDFLSDNQCSELIQTVTHLLTTPSEVSQGTKQGVDLATRKSSSILTNSAIQSEISRKISTLTPSLEKHFCTDLGALQNPVFLCYQTGDYFRPHCDNSENPEQPDHIRRRKISIVIFLNDREVVENNNVSSRSFEGGDLILYRLCNKSSRSSWDNYATIVRPKAGLLIGFTTSRIHEVTPILNGIRYSIACWFEKSIPK
jgi:predicted 2-oxoglutarate/Fe(II)-dependent dioxygenase YbiX